MNHTYPIAFKKEVNQMEWFDNCFIGRTVVSSKARDFEGEHHLGRFQLYSGALLGRKLCAIV